MSAQAVSGQAKPRNLGQSFLASAYDPTSILRAVFFSSRLGIRVVTHLSAITVLSLPGFMGFSARDGRAGRTKYEARSARPSQWAWRPGLACSILRQTTRPLLSGLAGLLARGGPSQAQSPCDRAPRDRRLPQLLVDKLVARKSSRAAGCRPRGGSGVAELRRMQ